jgi:hypothetical protein
MTGLTDHRVLGPKSAIARLAISAVWNDVAAKIITGKKET